MAETLAGGYYADAAGNLHDAAGNPLPKQSQAAAEKHAAEHNEQQARTEQLWTMAEAQRNPVAQALAGLMQQPQAAPQAPAEPAKKPE